MRSVFLTVVLSYLLLLGLSYPVAAALVYVWIDIVKPQSLAYSIINGMPLAMIAGVLALISHVISPDRKKIFGGPVIMLLLVFLAWITITTANANPGLNSWQKWDWVSKIVIFSVFLTFVIRSRVHIEAFLLTLIFSVETISFSGGVKAALGGGGYGVLALMGDANQGLAESSTFAAVCVMLFPIMHYLYHNSIIFPGERVFKAAIIGMAIINVFSIIGTGARTGLIAGAFLLLLYFLRSKYKLRMGIAMLVVGLGLLQLDLSGTAWGSRMSSIGTYQHDSSASGRIAVWQWTTGFAMEHPMGGGFDAFRLNNIAGVDESGIQYYEGPGLRGKAFHNVFFEVLGEQGFIGIAIYLALIALTFLHLRQIRHYCRTRAPLLWCHDLATKLGDAFAALLIGGMFVGIAYQCYIFYFFSIVVSLHRLVPKERGATNVTKSHAEKYT